MINLSTRNRFSLNTNETEACINNDRSPRKPIYGFFQMRSTTLPMLRRQRRKLSISLSLLLLFVAQYRFESRLHSISVQNQHIMSIHGSKIEQPNLSYEVTRDKSTSQGYNQRIVILASPHKTFISSIQKYMKLWTSSENNLLPEWEWLVPQLITEIESEYEDHSSIGFNALMESLLDQNGGIIYNQSIFGDIAENHLIKLYKTEFLRAWVKGYNIVVASEKMNSFINQDEGRYVLDDLIALMPWQFDNKIYINGNNQNLEIVIMYQASRLDHLVSIWQDNKNNSETFKDWIVKNDNQLQQWDSLGLVETLLNQGLGVVLIDLSGVEEDNLDIFNVTACNIFSINCNTNKEVLETRVSPIEINAEGASPVHNDLIGLNSNELTEMGNLLKIYECQYMDMLDSKRLTLLHSKGLNRNRQYCDGSKENQLSKFQSLSKLKMKLGCVVSDRDDC